MKEKKKKKKKYSFVGIRYKCPYCGATFKTRKAWVEHICKKHRKGICGG